MIRKSPFYEKLLEIADIELDYNENEVPIRPKAIRDRLEDKIQPDQGDVIQVNDNEMLHYMEMKVLEEFAEYLNSGTMNEFCDLLDVLERVQELRGWSDDAVRERRREKEIRKGKFQKNLILTDSII